MQYHQGLISSDWACNRSSLGGRLVYCPSATRMRYSKDNCQLSRLISQHSHRRFALEVLCRPIVSFMIGFCCDGQVRLSPWKMSHVSNSKADQRSCLSRDCLDLRVRRAHPQVLMRTTVVHVSCLVCTFNTHETVAAGDAMATPPLRNPRFP